MKNQFYKKSHTHSKFLCYNGIMLKTKTKVTIGFIGVISIAAGVQASSLVARQTVAVNTSFQVNVVESLSVSLTTPDSWASGSINTFLRNAVGVDVTSNNSAGFTASMYADTDATDSVSLVNASKSDATIPTMTASQQRSAFTANHWGYSLQKNADGTTNPNGDTGTESGDAEGQGYGSSSSYYNPVPVQSSAVTIIDGASTPKTSASQYVYFGAKADITQPAGAYEGTVIISVVSGATNGTPVDPDTKPSTDTQGDNPYYTSTNGYAGSTSGATVYNTSSSSAAAGTTTQTTEINPGDTRTAYRNPAGVTENTTSSINSSTPLATGLAVTAAVAATSGTIFFILAKRKKDDEEDEEEET